MEVVIHGTKGGYRSALFKTPDSPSIGSDIRNNVSSEAALGKSAYSIAFAANGCVFTKYIIIRDTLRSDATGFIAFSLFLLFNRELLNKGTDIKSILDELANHYMDNYVRNNSINKGETSIIQEDWSFVNNILGKRTEQDKTRNNIEVQPGTKEAAFVFYEDDAKLQEYFSKPFQEEYNGYKQILLISGGLRNDSADLLNALRNSGIELKVDLKNEPFFLNNYNRSKGITIIANGKPCSEGKNNNVIRAKEKVEIKFEKEYYKPIEGVTGTLSNPDSDIYKYLETRGNQISIKYDALSNNLKPIEKTLTFNIKDWKGNAVKDAEITCKNNDESKTITENQVTFRGEEIGKRWTVSAKNDRFFSEDKPINFERDCPGDTGSIDIILNKHKLTITAIEKSNGDLINNVSISKPEFIDSEIEKTHKITVSSREFESYSFDYSPTTDENPKPIALQRKQSGSGAKTIYSVSAGKHGTLKGGHSYNSNKQSGSDVKNIIVPNNGYLFTGFELQEDTLIAQYKKKESFYQSPKFIAGTITGAIAIGFGIWALFSSSGKDQPEQPEGPKRPDVQHIMAYIEGNSLILDTLNSYKNIQDVQQNDSSNKLDNAIVKRGFINSLNFPELKKLSYSKSQQKFKTAIETIDSTRYNDVKERLGDISSWSLDQIADSINAVLSPAQSAAENEPEIKKEEPQKEIKQPVNSEQKQENKSVSPPVSTNNEKKDIQKLQSATVTKNDLQNWKNAEMDRNKRSIELYLKFWDIVNNSGQKDDFDKLLKEVKNDNNLGNSALSKFLTEICASSNAFQKYNNASGKAACTTIAALKDKVK